MPVYRTAPFASPGMPPGIPFIVANAAAGRCSCYGMRVILAVHMVRFYPGRAWLHEAQPSSV